MHDRRFVPVGCVRAGAWIEATQGLDPERSFEPALARSWARHEGDLLAVSVQVRVAQPCAIAPGSDGVP